MLKKLLLGIALVTVCLIGAGLWVVNVLQDSELASLVATTPDELAYLDAKVTSSRGKILAIVTSTGKMGESGKRTGYEFTELSRAYYVFTANGFTVDIASPDGGRPPVVIDDDDMGEFDYAFLNDPVARSKVINSTAVTSVNPAEYAAVYFVGGKGAMWDFPDNEAIQNLVREFHSKGKVIGAICHGPAALVNVKLDSGEYFLASKQVSGFSNDEELFLIPEARTIFPFLLEDRLRARGAAVQTGPSYLEQVSRDGALLTGQNPWSVWALTESMIVQLGYQPVPRKKTADEYSVQILGTYEQHGYRSARAQLEFLAGRADTPINYRLIAMHSLVAAMKMEPVKAMELVMIAAGARQVGGRL
jgi:putative intracellular protease/amidase